MLTRVGRIPYVNAAPFYIGLDRSSFKLVDLAPRPMGEAARRGEIDAGPLSLLDFLSLREDFEPLGDYVIGVTRAAGSVLVFSRRPPAELGAECAVDLGTESTTGARLAKMILRERFGATPRCVTGEETAEARLLIGDEALLAGIGGLRDHPHVLDLGRAWWDWHRLPFVFAVWGVRRGVPPEDKAKLAGLVGDSLRAWERPRQRGECVEVWAGTMGMESADLAEYFGLLNYRRGPDETEAMEVFQMCLKREEEFRCGGRTG